MTDPQLLVPVYTVNVSKHKALELLLRQLGHCTLHHQPRWTHRTHQSRLRFPLLLPEPTTLPLYKVQPTRPTPLWSFVKLSPACSLSRSLSYVPLFPLLLVRPLTAEPIRDHPCWGSINCNSLDPVDREGDLCVRLFPRFAIYQICNRETIGRGWAGVGCGSGQVDRSSRWRTRDVYSRLAEGFPQCQVSCSSRKYRSLMP